MTSCCTGSAHSRVFFSALVAFATCLASAVQAAPPSPTPAGSAPAHRAGSTKNILWITCEDMSPDLGCWGDAYSKTPVLDKFASQGTRYTKFFTHAGVCAPSRSGLITGMYPTTLGTMHMRSKVPPPAEVRCFPAYLREAGWWCTNNSKTDYNFPVPEDAWDQNGAQAHWRNRKDKSQPFFAVFNFTITHESQARPTPAQAAKNTARLTPDQRHDPALAPLPPYYPDTPTVRKNIATYYDTISAMDHQVGDVLAQLEEDGLADETIVFFFSDHGRGLTRGKRWLYDSGLHAPLIVRQPGRDGWIAAGKTNDELTAFVDMAPTVLRLAGLTPPPHLQGKAFLGLPTVEKNPEPTPAREYVYAARDRMDERYDLIRAVRDGRWKYIRNYTPWKPYSQNISYMNQMPILQEMRALHAAGKLSPAAELWFADRKPAEELYDTQSDPHEVQNLAADPGSQEVLNRLRKAHVAQRTESHDLGVVPEAILKGALAADPKHWRRAFCCTGGDRLGDLWRLAEPLSPTPEAVALWEAALSSDDPAARWWGATRLVESNPAPGKIIPLLKDPVPVVRIAAADALRRLAAPGWEAEVLPVLTSALADDEESTALSAALVFDEMGEAARPAVAPLKAAAEKKRSADYVLRVVSHALQALGEKDVPGVKN